MAEWLTPQFWVAALQIVVINLLLSGDNAVVIALACRNLPPAQRRLGIFWGVFGAIALRIVLTFFAVSLLELPWLKLGGAALLLWIGVKLIEGESAEAHDIQASERLWGAIRTVVIADAVMSLDNVIGVAGAARGSIALLVFGLVVSIPIVVLGSQIVMKLIARFPLLVVAGGGLLGYIAGELAVDDPVMATHAPVLAMQLHFIGPLVATLFVMGLGVWRSHRHKTSSPS
ncbi:MAG TPA: TerC family protein [Candidatus Binatia bacterium]|nr:TerC family protein [Candidatus Binatia bacterium]